MTGAGSMTGADSTTVPVRVVVFTRDLMDGSRFRALGEGVEVRRTPHVDPGAVDPGAVDPGAVDLIVVDLAGGYDLDALVAVGPPVLAYGAHVDTDALERALAAGCAAAVPRSVVVRRVAAVVAGDA
jgi:hypothetical protein